MTSSALDLAPVAARGRQLAHYPSTGRRRASLALVVAITVALYYALYVGSGVAPLMLADLHMPFTYFVGVLAIGNLVGAFASLLAGLCDRFGRSNLVVAGLLLVALITLFGIPNAHTPLAFGIWSVLVGMVEGVILVATPALIRDFSPQVGRATAMGFWTIGPVLGSLMVSALATLTLPIFKTWQSQFEICGAMCLATFVLAFLFLRELAPGLRDQVMVSERDRALIEARAAARQGVQGPGAVGAFTQLLRPEIVASAFGVSVLLLFYYTAVAFGTIYLVTVFHLSVAAANAVGNWGWATNAVALIVAGVASDCLRVRKPFMLAGGLGAALFLVAYLAQAGGALDYWRLVGLTCGQSICVGCAYATWMASFTETVESVNPAATATGLAIWGWLLRLVVTASFVAIPFVISSVTPLVGAPHVLGALAKAQAAHEAPPPALIAALEAIKSAAVAAPAQWRAWYWICVAGIVVFLATIFVMRGYWSPAAAAAAEARHDEAARQELARLSASRR